MALKSGTKWNVGLSDFLRRVSTERYLAGLGLQSLPRQQSFSAHAILQRFEFSNLSFIVNTQGTLGVKSLLLC